MLADQDARHDLAAVRCDETVRIEGEAEIEGDVVQGQGYGQRDILKDLRCLGQRAPADLIFGLLPGVGASSAGEFI